MGREVTNFIFSRDFVRMSVLWTLALLLSYTKVLIDGLCGKTLSYARCRRDASTRPICIVTGATSGLGAAAAKALWDEGYHVILAGRSTELLSKIVDEAIRGNVFLKAFEVDLTSLDSMLKFRESVEDWLLDSGLHPSIQLLINNAGILATSQSYTVDGYERMIGTNYFGPFTLTHILLPLLQKSYHPSRIVNVTSFTHRFISDIHVTEKSLASGDLHCISCSKSYPFASIYEYSKLCLLMFTYELNRQLCLLGDSNNVTVMAADPGVVKTGIMRDVPFCISQTAYAILGFVGLLQSPEKGINSIVDAALAPPEASGKYFFGGNGRTIESSSLSFNRELCLSLWECSNKLLHDKLSRRKGRARA